MSPPLKKKRDKWHSLACHHHCRCNDSWENSEERRRKLAAHKSPAIVVPKTQFAISLGVPLCMNTYSICIRKGCGTACIWVCVCAENNAVNHYLNLFHRISSVDVSKAQPIDLWLSSEAFSQNRNWQSAPSCFSLSLSLYHLPILCLSLMHHSKYAPLDGSVIKSKFALFLSAKPPPVFLLYLSALRTISQQRAGL